MVRDSHGGIDAQRSTKPATQRSGNSKPSAHERTNADTDKSRKDPLNSEETLRRNENGNS